MVDTACSSSLVALPSVRCNESGRMRDGPSSLASHSGRARYPFIGFRRRSHVPRTPPVEPSTQRIVVCMVRGRSHLGFAGGQNHYLLVSFGEIVGWGMNGDVGAPTAICCLRATQPELLRRTLSHS